MKISTISFENLSILGRDYPYLIITGRNDLFAFITKGNKMRRGI